MRIFNVFYLRGGTLLIITVAIGSPPETPRRTLPLLRSASALTGITILAACG
jgi:hypothetical protein